MAGIIGDAIPADPRELVIVAEFAIHWPGSSVLYFESMGPLARLCISTESAGRNCSSHILRACDYCRGARTEGLLDPAATSASLPPWYQAYLPTFRGSRHTEVRACGITQIACCVAWYDVLTHVAIFQRSLFMPPNTYAQTGASAHCR